MAKSSKFLVTGASGLLGHALMDELQASTTEQVVGVTSRDVDLTDFEATRDLFTTVKPDVIYHLAARVFGVMGNLHAQGQGYLDNMRMNTNVVEAARLAGTTKVVAMGSAAIYSDSVTLPMSEDQIWNGAPHFSEAGYAHAKRGMLAHLDAYRDQYGLDYAYCVSTNLFGPHDRFDEQFGHVLPSLLSKFLRANQTDGAVTIWGTGTPQRDFLYSKDAALALRMIGEGFTGPINLATGKAISIADTVQVIAEVSGFKGAVEWDRTKPDGQKLRAYDVSKLAALGFAPRYTLRESLAETYAWLERNVATARR
ncbi:MAG: GDP-L-fucose synthase [Nevskia sp.]|nr:GDP-L-fucose synthase [Nevskia sp.]